MSTTTSTTDRASEATGALADLTLQHLPPPGGFETQLAFTDELETADLVGLRDELPRLADRAVIVHLDGPSEVRGYTLYSGLEGVYDWMDGVHVPGPVYSPINQWRDLEAWNMDVERVWISGDLSPANIPD